MSLREFAGRVNAGDPCSSSSVGGGNSDDSAVLPGLWAGFQREDSDPTKWLGIRLVVCGTLLLLGRHRAKAHDPHRGSAGSHSRNVRFAQPAATSGSFGSRGPALPTARHAVPVDGARASLIRYMSKHLRGGCQIDRAAMPRHGRSAVMPSPKRSPTGPGWAFCAPSRSAAALLRRGRPRLRRRAGDRLASPEDPPTRADRKPARGQFIRLKACARPSTTPPRPRARFRRRMNDAPPRSRASSSRNTASANGSAPAAWARSIAPRTRGSDAPWR